MNTSRKNFTTDVDSTRWRDRVAAVRHREVASVRRSTGALLALILGLAIALGPFPNAASAAPDETAPVVAKVLSYIDKIDQRIDELRASIALKVPHGYVDPETGALNSVNGKTLRIAFDLNASNGNTRPEFKYINTMRGKAGAQEWANNNTTSYTIHQVIPGGTSDLLIISLESDMNIGTPVRNKRDVTRLYFSYSEIKGDDWVASALTTYPLELLDNPQGPMAQMTYDNSANFWSQNQANWAAVLDFGLDGYPEGVLPPNSVAAEIINRYYAGHTGPTGSVSDSFWYAWVNEDGTLVKSINTGPIHVTGVSPSAGALSQGRVKNTRASSATDPTLSYTDWAAAQGLQDTVHTDGSINFAGAGGTGMYRLAVWPEAHNPRTVRPGTGGPEVRYAAPDLFTADGAMTNDAVANMWTVGSVFYHYGLPLPDAPVIDAPAHGTPLNNNRTVTFRGHGTPGHSITLKLLPGSPITDFHDAGLTTLVDGDRDCSTECEVVVDGDGQWTYTYTPDTPLADGQYTAVAVQTEQSSGYALTSGMSNPDAPADATQWGVTFEIDTTAPQPPSISCVASPTGNANPTFTGGVDAGATVQVYRDGEPAGSGVVDGTTWTFTVDTPLDAGNHVFTVKQVDQAGNESSAATPCSLLVQLDVPIVGTTSVASVDSGPDLTIARPDASNWDVVAESGDTTLVLNGDEPAALKRDVTYTIGERLRPSAADNAKFYGSKGRPACTDGRGAALPDDVFNATTNQLTVRLNAMIEPPITCAITNQASHVALVTKRVGGQTQEVTAGWALKATNDNSQFDRTVDDTHQVVDALPSRYLLESVAPEPLRVVALEKLDAGTPSCVEASANPLTAPESCWVKISGQEKVAHEFAQGSANVYRIVAASPQDMPPLPLTGGLGTSTLIASGVGLILLAIAALVLRRSRSAKRGMEWLHTP